MANTCTAYKWNNDRAYSFNFSFTTKYYNFSDVTILKNIYKISVNWGVDEGKNTIGIGMPLLGWIDYRTNQNEAFLPYGSFGAGTYTNYANSDPQTTSVIEKQLKSVPGIQLKISGMFPNAFTINDISIEYRSLRTDKSVGRPS